MGVFLELTFSGLCLLVISSNAASNGIMTQGEAEVRCADNREHPVYMTVSAKNNVISMVKGAGTLPSGWKWTVAPNGEEFASLEVAGYYVEIVEQGQETKKPWIDQMFDIRQSGVRDLYEPPEWEGGTLGSRIPLPAGGHLVAKPRIRDRSGGLISWCITETTPKTPIPKLTDDLVWSGETADGTVVLNFYKGKPQPDFSVHVEPYSLSDRGVQIGFAADVLETDAPQHGTTELKHLYHLQPLVAMGQIMRVPMAGTCDKWDELEALVPEARERAKGLLSVRTSRPICNVSKFVRE